VFDPACGPGTLLLATASELPEALLNAGAVRSAGVDADLMCVALARLKVRLHGLESLTTFVERRAPQDQVHAGTHLLVLR